MSQARYAPSTLLLELALDRLRERWCDDETRAEACAAITRELDALGTSELPASLIGAGTPRARLLQIVRHARGVLDGFAVPLETDERFGAVAARGYHGNGITIDGNGFRHTMHAGHVATHDEFAAAPHPLLITGNSTSWGVGVSGDDAHVASALHARWVHDDDHVSRCFNASIKGSCLAQHAAIVEALLPDGGDVVVVAGVLDLIFALAWPRDDVRGALAYWAPGGPDETRDGDWALDPGAYAADDACAVMAASLRRIADVTRARGGHALLVMQPHLDFTPKQPTAQEASLGTALSTDLGAFCAVHASGVLRAHADAFTTWLETEAARAGVHVVDSNRDPEFCSDAERFLDHIHVNDAGHQRLAACIDTWRRVMRPATGR